MHDYKSIANVELTIQYRVHLREIDDRNPFTKEACVSNACYVWLTVCIVDSRLETTNYVGLGALIVVDVVIRGPYIVQKHAYSRRGGVYIH